MIVSLRYIGNFFLVFSFAGLILVSVFTSSTSSKIGDINWRKPIVGMIFGFTCILGIIAGIFPSKCSSIFHFSKRSQEKAFQNSAHERNGTSVFLGHHPSCGRFSAHIFRINHKVLCAGCVGLILGAIISLFGVASYFFFNMNLLANSGIFWIGVLGVSCGLLQYHLFNLNRSLIHLSLNIFFVFGMLLLLIGVDFVTQNTSADFYVIALSIFWLYTRILLSKVDHKKICNVCGIKNCELTRKGF